MLRKDHEVRESHLQGSIIQEGVKISEEQFKDTRKNFNQQTKQKTTPKPANDFWSMEKDFIFRHHVELRVRPFVPKEEAFPIPLKYIDVTKSIHTNLDVMQDKRINDNCKVDVDRILSDP